MINMLYRGIMLAVVGCSTAAVLAQRFDCDPCVDRSGYTVKAIVHGPSEEAFWQYMKAVMVQAGKDMKVNFVMDLYDVFDSDIMAADIRAAAASSPPPDALIVTIPTQEVQDAVAEVKDSMPIFAFNSAPNDGEFMRSLDGMVHMNEFIGGQIVGKYVNEVLDAKAAGEGPSSVTSKGLFVNHVPGNDSIESRFNGLVDAAGDSVEWEMYAPELIDAEGLTAVFADCTYSAIQLAGFVSMNATLTALENNGCLESDYVLGTYDVDTDIYDLIELGIVDVAVSQQQFIQASTVVVMASLFATTGEKLAVPYQGDAYLSGPFLVTQTNLPSQTLQVCAGDGFPVCPNTISPLGETSTCACTERKEIKIVAITHATTTDIFWDPVYAGFTQAASDFGITLETRRFDPEFLDSDVIEEQILSIQDACNQDIDGLIVSFPSVDVIEAVANCTTKGIPVIGVNAGPDLAANSGYKYVGQVDYRAGLEAGQRLIEAGAVQGWCMSHANVTVLADRCGGFQQAYEDAAGTQFMGVIEVPPDNETQYQEIVEAALGEGNWTGYGALAAGEVQIAPMINVVKDHPELLAGAFDVDTTLYQALDAGELLFGIDQRAYIQGYWPVVALTWQIYTSEAIVTAAFETGPDFVVTPPSDAAQSCFESNYAACNQTTPDDGNNSDSTGNNDAPVDNGTGGSDAPSGDAGNTSSASVISKAHFAGLIAAFSHFCF